LAQYTPFDEKLPPAILEEALHSFKSFDVLLRKAEKSDNWGMRAEIVSKLTKRSNPFTELWHDIQVCLCACMRALRLR
jgi:hypothetical protein